MPDPHCGENGARVAACGLVRKTGSVIIAVVGPTATGKSDLAVALAGALNGEVLNADASQLYRGMDVGTAKLTVAERRGIPHHLLDVLDVTEDATVAAYQRAVDLTLGDVLGRGKTAVLVGGSGLYVRAALDELDIPPTDPILRAALEAEAERAGPSELHRRLAIADPLAAARIPPANVRRVVRALEVVALTGRPFSATLPQPVYRRPTIQLGLQAPRDVLDRRIEERVVRMWDGGLLAEVTRLDRAGLRSGRTASRAVGYAQALAQLDGLTSGEVARADTARLTRRLARRQQSWFGRDHRITWLDTAVPDPAVSDPAVSDPDGPDLLTAALAVVRAATDGR
jgi:tRNA dimethylallyltransferase